MKFTKMEGAGNDYVYIDCFREKVRNPEKLAGRISNRHFGVGSDGLILIQPSSKADARMVMFNPDGSRSEMCGNGIRCVAKYVYDHGIAKKKTLDIETDAGVKRLKLFIAKGVVDRVRVDMGEPQLDRAKIPMKGPPGRVVNEQLTVLGRAFNVTAVNMGNPHCVAFIDDVDGFDLAKYGPAVERHPSFPRRTNAEFVEVTDRRHLKMRVWERGTGETLACGSGACAVCVAASLNGLAERKVSVRLPGGVLAIEWRASDHRVLKTGPAREVFEGEWTGRE